MNIHTTNYQDTFIMVADDCVAEKGEVPKHKNNSPTIASLQFDLISSHPYQYTSDDVLFQVYAKRKNLVAQEMEEARKLFFSKGQACLRASPLTKRYGWGIHSDREGKIALYGRETRSYKAFARNKNLNILKAMRSSK